MRQAVRQTEALKATEIEAKQYDLKASRYKELVLASFVHFLLILFLGDEVGVSLVRGHYCQLAVGLCDIDTSGEGAWATRWLSWHGVGLASADRLPVVVRIPAGPGDPMAQLVWRWSCQRWQTAGGGSNPCWSTRESQVRPAERQRAPTKKKIESLLVHSGVSRATRRKATDADQKKKRLEKVLGWT